MDEFTLNDFTSYFQNEIYNYTLKYEKYRIFTKITAHIIMPIVFTALWISMAFSDGFLGNWFAFIMAGLFGLIAAHFFCYMFLKKMYQNKIKKEILPKVLKFVNMEVGDKELIKGVPGSIAASLNIFPHFEYCKCDDYIIGEYKGLKLKIYDIELTRTSGPRKHRRTITLFNGALVCLPDLNFQKADIVIGSHSSKTPLEQIEVENETFNNEYSVYTSNPDEAKSFLTPDVIDKIIQYIELNGKFYFSFEQNMLNLKISFNDDLFEVSFDKNPSDITNYVNIINEIEAIYEKLDLIMSLINNNIEEN